MTTDNMYSPTYSELLEEENIKLREQVEQMQSDVDFLSCLRAAGVDNWSGYDEACEMFDPEDDE